MKNFYFLKTVFLLLLISCLAASDAFAVNYYVSAGTGSDTNNNGLTPTTAFASIQKAADMTNPGDNVYIMNGTYSQTFNRYSIHATVLYVSRSGSAAGGYITYQNYPGHTPKISGVNCRWNCVLIRANYIKFIGIEVEGPNQSITYEQAKEMYDYYVRGGTLNWNLIGTMNTNGISLGGGGNPTAGTIFHHLEVRNCIVHDFQGGGIGGSDFDYITIADNIVYNNSWYAMYATSGISVFHTQNFDNNTTSYKIIVSGNLTHNNKALIPWAGRDILSDGNGIIIDDNRNTQLTNGIPYTGRTLVENNVSYNNGGSGIHAYYSNNVDIINNTAYNNGTVVGYPEIYGQDGTNVRVYNNIMYARRGGAANSNASGTTYDYNIYFNGPASRMGANDIIADPKFVRLALDGTADLRLRNTSPAVNSGTSAAGLFSPKDIEGVTRPIGAKPDRGAYESPFTALAVVPELLLRHGTSAIANRGTSHAFGDVFYNAPKTLTFTIENKGGAQLNLTGSPKVSVTGAGFALTEDAPATIAPGASATFRVTLTTAADMHYSGTINIASNDPYDNPYTVTLTGRGMDPAKALQTITFNALPLKNNQSPDFAPGGFASSGLPVSYTSSNTSVATIVDGNIRIVGIGNSIITASQAGNAITHPAPDVRQVLTVSAVTNLVGSNLLANPTFNTNANGWGFANQNSGSGRVETVEESGYGSRVAKVIIQSQGTTVSPFNVQFGANVAVQAGKTYAITFKASTATESLINLILIMNQSPWQIRRSQNAIKISDIPTTYGPFTFNSTATETLVLRFLLGNVTDYIIIDDVEMFEVNTSVTSASNGLEKEALQVYPNPSTGHVKLVMEAKHNEAVEISLVNVQGKEVYKKVQKAAGGGPTVLDLNFGVVPGYYILRVTNGNHVQQKPLVVH